MSSEQHEPKAIIWDLDGTIIDSISVFHKMADEVFPLHGLPLLSREDIRVEFHGSFEDSIKRMSSGYHDHDRLIQDMFEAQMQHYDEPITHDGLLMAIQHFNQHQFTQAVVTSRGNEGRGKGGAREIVKSIGADSYIETVICADDSPNHKPHPEPLLMALDRLRVKPHRAVMVGDQPADALAARAAGTYSVIIDHEDTEHSRASLYDLQPDRICHTAAELLEAVDSLFDDVY